MKRYALGLAFLAGALVALTLERVLVPQPHVCDHYSEVAYNHLDEPLCVIVRMASP